MPGFVPFHFFVVKVLSVPLLKNDICESLMAVVLLPSQFGFPLGRLAEHFGNVLLVGADR